MRKIIILFSAVSFIIFSCNPKPDTSNTVSTTVSNSIPQISYTISNSYPHDTNSFTEGFLFHNGKLYESTGATSELPQTRSLFGIVDLKTGIIDVKVEIDKTKYFGEGITFLNGKVYQLTYQTKVGFIYDEKTFRKKGEFTIPSDEGWGMTTDGKDLIMSDGTNYLSYLDPENLNVIKKISVSENGYEVDKINELEFINGYIYANIWTTYKIIKINPADGKVVGELDLTSVAEDAKFIYQRSLEMNGIAYDESKKKLLITGKMWMKIYELNIEF